MGADAGLLAPVTAAARASLDTHGPHIILVGDGPRLEAALRGLSHDAGRVSIHHTPHAVPMDAKPAAALDAMPDASVAEAAGLVASGRAQAMVSAGNTGGVVLACSRRMNRLPGVRRCALAAVVPTRRRRGEKHDPFMLMLDVGATLSASAEDLVAFAVMGSAYAARISRNAAPRVALLSNGAEPTKGRPEVVTAHAMLRRHPWLNFTGNVEGVDLTSGAADVVITDGFTGNVVLKMLEGISETVMELGRYAYRKKLTWRLGLTLLSGGIRQLRQVTDWQEYGGAPVLGFEGVCIKAHGRSGDRALGNAIKVAHKAARTGLVQAMREGLSQAAQAQALSEPPAPEEPGLVADR